MPNLSAGTEHVKCEHLRAFGRSYLGNAKWTMTGVGEGAERDLLEGFGSVSVVFNRLPAASQEVIRDIATRMGDGMAEYVSVDMGQGTISVDAYNRFCRISSRSSHQSDVPKPFHAIPTGHFASTLKVLP